MRISFDPKKRDITLAERGLDFADALEVFAGLVFEQEDRRLDYGETRMVTLGWLRATADFWDAWSFWSGRRVAKPAISFR